MDGVGRYAPAMSRLRRRVVCDRYFFVTCNRVRTRTALNDDDFEILARVIEARRREHGFLLTAWVFLPDRWHAIPGPRYPLSVSRVLETLKVASTRRINARQKMSGRLWRVAQTLRFNVCDSRSVNCLRCWRRAKAGCQHMGFLNRRHHKTMSAPPARPEDWR